MGKPHFSQGYAAIVCQTTTNTSVTPNVSNLTETAVPFPYRYTSMYRIFAGYHLTNCGGDINFTYWNLQSTAATRLGPADVTDGTNIILGQVLNNPADGQFLSAIRHSREHFRHRLLEVSDQRRTGRTLQHRLLPALGHALAGGRPHRPGLSLRQ